jgi:uncharacterized protein
MKLPVALGLFLSCCIPALASETEGGSLNPEEMSLARNAELASKGKVDFVICASGYLMTKHGDHEAARTVFEECARQGYTGAMTWMSYLDDNGFGAPENAERASNWDLKAAEMGDPIAQFNYGLDLLRGRGVEANSALGKQYVNRAADSGLKDAVALRDSGYDYTAATPDADEWKYLKPVF